MMRFNQSVILSSVLTLLSDAARQDKFGVFKVDPDSIKQVFRASDGSESTTKGKCYKESVGSECLIGPNENRKFGILSKNSYIAHRYTITNLETW